MGHKNDLTRVIPLSPSAEPIFIGRASKTASKGLVAASENAWFDSPIMSRQHGKIFMTSSGAVSSSQDDSLASTHPSSRSNYKISHLHMGLGFGTSAWQQMKFVIFSMETLSPSDLPQQASPTSSSCKGSDQSGFRVPDAQYESLSDDSDADDCKIMASHPRTFSVPSSGDEMDESDGNLEYAAAGSISKSTARPSCRARVYRGSHARTLWDHVRDQDQRSSTKPYARPTIIEAKSDGTSRMNALYDDDTEDEEPAYAGQPTDIESYRGSTINPRSSSPDIEVPDTYASMGLSKTASVTAVYGDEVPTEQGSNAKDPLSEVNISRGKMTQDEMIGYDSADDFFGPPSTSHEAEVRPYSGSDTHKELPIESDKAAPLMPAAIPSQGQVIRDGYESSSEPEQDEHLARTVIGQAGLRRARGDSSVSGSSSLDMPSKPSGDESEDDNIIFGQGPIQSKFAAAAAMTSDARNKEPLLVHMQTLNSCGPSQPNAPLTGSHIAQPLRSKYLQGDDSLHPSEYVSNIARAPSPSDAALVRKASLYPPPYQPPTRQHSSAYHTSPYDLATTEELSFTRPLYDSFYSQSRNALRSWSDYYPNADQFSHSDNLPSLNDRWADYQQGPFSRSYGRPMRLGITPERWSSSPPPQSPHESCLVKLKIDAKTMGDKSQDLLSSVTEGKSKKVDISNLVNPHAEGARSLKRKSDQMSSEESSDGRALATLESSSSQTISDGDLGPDAQARDPIAAGNETISQELGTDTTSALTNVTREATEQGPARKKIKMSTPKAGTVGKIVSGVCLGLAGAFAAFVAATPAEVWDEALREAVKLA
ncbi:MAG: hypothetical protein Q9168_006993 [Polycauliona sp. 1 TL-2023]